MLKQVSYNNRVLLNLYKGKIVVGKNPSLITYPIFRLAVSMATGIFLFDQFLTGYVSVLAQSTFSLDYSMLKFVACGVMLILFLSLVLIHRAVSFAHKRIFGIITSISFLLFGGIRLIQEYERIDFHWNDTRSVYWGEVITPPVVKGKTFQAEVRVKIHIPNDTAYVSSLKNSSTALFDGTSSTSIIPDRRNGTIVDRTILLYWMPDSLQRPVTCGDNILFYSTISQPVSDKEVSGFDYATYLYRKGISGTAMAFVNEWKVYERNNPLSVKQIALLCRNWIVSHYRQWQLGPDEFAVVSALTVGDKSVLSSSLKDVYSAAGVSHVLALSGLHIGILSAILFFLFLPIKRMRYGGTIRPFLVVVALWSFAFVSGLSPSVVRAVTMCSLYFLATCFLEEQFSGIYALVLAAFIMLIYQPFYLFDLSFQLSFLAVASILYFYPILSGCFHLQNKLLKWLWNGIAVSVSAQLGTLPLILYYFGTFPTYFLLANLIVSVLATCVLCGAIVALLMSHVPYINDLTLTFLNFSTLSMNQSIKWVHQLTGSQIEAVSISALQAVCGFLFLYGLYQYVLRRKSTYILCMLVAFNVAIIEWAVRPLLPVSPTLYFSRSQLFLKTDQEVRELTSVNGLYTVDTLKIGVINDTRWSYCQAVPSISLDYLYLCRGFQGNLKTLVRIFHINQLVLDSSLSFRYREYLKKECDELKIPYTDISEKGSYRILL